MKARSYDTVRLLGQSVSRTPAAHPFQRSRVGQDPGVSDQQYELACVGNLRVVQEPMASRIVLQVDQATPAHQTFSGNQRERSQDANLVRRSHLCTRGYRQKTASPGCLALHMSTDPVGVRFRENRDFMRLAA